MNHLSIKKCFLVFILVVGIIHIGIAVPNSLALAMVKSKTVDYTGNIDIRSGDFIFQHLPGPLTEMIISVDGGRYSHCGLIMEERRRFYVLEAIGPVKKTPINEWIARGIHDQFTVVRLREEYQDMIPAMIQAAQAYQGRPYDIQYEWDDQKIYCSELLYKAVRDASGMALAKFDRLGDMNWQPHEKTIRELSGGKLPLDRLMITPDAIAFSDKVRTIFSSFPVVSKGSRIYNEKELAGVWEGCYTLVQQRLSLDMEISQNGEISHGRLQQGLVFDPVMLKQLNPRTGEFFYEVVSENKLKIHIAGRMDHAPGAIYGEWKDSLGFCGMFYLTKR